MSARNYDKYTYSYRRNQYNEKAAAFAKTVEPRSAFNKQNMSSSSSSSAPDVVVGLDPSISVLNPLRPSCYNFAIAEDGVLHSRVVAPPRICYAPVIQEIDAPVMPLTALERLKKVLRLPLSSVNESTTPTQRQHSSFFNEEATTLISQAQQDLALASQDWNDISDALMQLQRQDLDKEEQLMLDSNRAREDFSARATALRVASASASASSESEKQQQQQHKKKKINSSSNNAVAVASSSSEPQLSMASERATLQRQWQSVQQRLTEQREWLQQESISPVDWAKIEIIWKRARTNLLGFKNSGGGKSIGAIAEQVASAVAAASASRAAAVGAYINEDELIERLHAEDVHKQRTSRSPKTAKKQKEEAVGGNTNTNVGGVGGAADRRSNSHGASHPSAAAGGGTSRYSYGDDGDQNGGDAATAAAFGEGSAAGGGGYGRARFNDHNTSTSSRAGSAASAATSASAARPKSARGANFTIFNERLSWTNRPKVDTNNHAL